MPLRSYSFPLRRPSLGLTTLGELGGFYQKPQLKSKRGEGRSAQRCWAALDYLTALQCPPGIRCGRGRLNLLLHHHHLPPHALHCLHGTRPALSPGEGSSELAALFANEDGRESGNGRVTQQGDRMETKMQHPGKRENKRAGMKAAGSLAHPGLEHRNFPFSFESQSKEKEAVWITSSSIQFFSPHKN